MASIMEGLFAGRSGIQSHGSAISVLADNIANSNTVGFKASRAEFMDLLAGNIAGQGSATAVGSGSTIANVTQIFTQGSFEFTGRGLDIAIDGDGFFILQDLAGTRFFSRAGNLTIDAGGYLRNQNGNLVLGFPTDGSGGLQAINVNDVSTETNPTQNINVSGNLDAGANIGGGDPFDPADPLGTTTWAQLTNEAEFSTFATIYDSLGASHTVTTYFFKTDANEWEASVFVDASEIDGATASAGAPYRIGGPMTMNFQSDGTRAAVGSPDMTLAIDWANQSANSSIALVFNPFTQFSTPSNITSITQDGSPSGSVNSFSVETDGTLNALLDNGETAQIGKIGMATFSNPEGLRRSGDSRYIESHESGQPVIGTPQTGKFGALESGALELSTADIAADFIRLISIQRGFQGSSRIITNIDDLLNEIINLA